MASAALASLNRAIDAGADDPPNAPHTERDHAPRATAEPDHTPRDREAGVATTRARDAMLPLLHPRQSPAPAESRESPSITAVTTTSLESARAVALRDTSMLHGGFAPAASVSAEVSPRARLVVIAKDGGEGASYPIGESMDIGRAEGHITIPDDRYLSPRHARIARRASDGRLILRDLGSTNGIYLRLRPTSSSSTAASISADAIARPTSAGPDRSGAASAMPAMPATPAAAARDAKTRDLLANAPNPLEKGVIARPHADARFDGRTSEGDLDRHSGRLDVTHGALSGAANPAMFDRAPAEPSQAVHRLADQDLFLVGQQVLRFEVVSDARGEEGLGSASEHGTLLFGTPASPRYARLSQRTVEGVSRDVFYIRKAETVLGRESGDIVFTEDPFLSRRHALLRVDVDTGRFLLADLGSSNGTFIQLRGEVPLQTGDQFRIGQQLFRIDIA